jgi:transposase
MYFREKTTPSGQVLQLVESFRNDEGQPRQRVVVSLGDALIAQQDRPLVASLVEHQLYGQGELPELGTAESVLRWSQRIVGCVRAEKKWMPLGQSRDLCSPGKSVDGVLIEQLDHDSKADLGSVLVGLDAWQRLGMDECLEQLGFNPAQRLAATLDVINRLVDPVSENALAQWVSTTALPDLLGAQALKCDRDRFYRVNDLLLKQHKQIESHLRKRQKEQFGLERTMILYDLTNTYFEGTASANRKARRGKSKHKRDDCPQVVVGMVFDEYGFELAHEVFEGNTHDSKTLVHMIEQLRSSVVADDDQQLLEPSKPLVILDGGIATQANRRWLRRAGYAYLVNETRTARANWAKEFSEQEKFQAVAGRDQKRAVATRVIEHRFADDDKQVVERVVLCKSQGRQQKEEAIRTRSEERFVQGLESLAKRIESGNLKDVSKIERSIGRLQSQYSRVSRFYTIKLETNGSLKLVWGSRDQEREDADALLGCYVLRSYDAAIELTSSQLWEIYMMLSRAEDGFRSLKSYLGLRPLRHHGEKRCDAHIFLSVLAYHLLRDIQYRLERSGDTRNWESLKRVLCTHAYATMIVPTVSDGTYRVRRAGRPDELVQALYEKLNIEWKKLPVTREYLPALPTTL